jgi:hypothetical protein
VPQDAWLLLPQDAWLLLLLLLRPPAPLPPQHFATSCCRLLLL